jgi:NitT/TauT family transport system permease protein
LRGNPAMKRLLNLRLPRRQALALGSLPFVLMLVLYAWGSAHRLAANPDDKVLPSFSTLATTVARLATAESPRTGSVLLWADTGASLRRLGLGVGIAALVGLTAGVALGALPVSAAGFSPFVATLSMVPPLAILPILFIVFGLGELAKVVLIVIGIAPVITRDVEQRARELPRELIVKAQTLGASTWQTVLRVVVPQVLPRLIDAVRLSLGSAWLFLIAAEAIAATEGLGYRIFLVRRYLAMDVILPYVAWITLLAYAMDAALHALSRRAFPWYHARPAPSDA